MPDFGYDDGDRERWARQSGAAVAAAAAATRKKMAAKIKALSAMPSSSTAVFNPEDWAAEVDSTIEPAFRSVATEAVDAFNDGVRGGLDDAARAILAGVIAYEMVNQLASRDEVVANRVDELISRSPEAAADTLIAALGLDEEHLSGPMSDALAEAMGASASTALAEGASVAVIDAAGLVGTKTWHCMFANSRDSHMDADGQTVPVEEPFVLENGEGMYPGDPDLPAEEACNCQCWLTYSVESPAGEIIEGETATGEDVLEALAASLSSPASWADQAWSTYTSMARRTLPPVTDLLAAPPSTFSIDPETPAGAWVANAHEFGADLDGVIITVEPTPPEKGALAIDGGEPADRIHCTLAMLGTTATLDDEAKRIIGAVCASFGPQIDPIGGRVGGIGWFGAADSMTLALVDAPGLSALRAQIVSALADAGYPPVDDHDFTPHLTLAYGQIDASEKVGMPITFNELRLRWGVEVLAFDLLGPSLPPAPVEPVPEVQPVPPEEAPVPAPAAPPLTTVMPAAFEAPPEAAGPPPDVSAVPNEAIVLELARRLADEAARSVEGAGGVIDPAARAMLEEAARAELVEALHEVVGEIASDALEEEAEPAGEPAPVSAAAIRERLRNRAVELADVIVEAPVPGAAPQTVTCPGCGLEVTPTPDGLCPECGTMCMESARFDSDAASVTEFEWEGVLTVEGILSGDGRMIAENSLTWRDLPVPLMLQTVNASGHEGAVFCGWIHEIDRVGSSIVGRGTFTDDDAGAAARAILTDPAGANKFGVSVDIDRVQMVFADPSGVELNPDEQVEVHLYGGSPDVVEMLVAGRVMGATLTPFPAFQEAQVHLIAPAENPDAALVASAAGPIWRLTGTASGLGLIGARPLAALVASAGGDEDDHPAPSTDLFQCRPMDEPEPFGVGIPLPDGTIPVYGLVTEWGTCHIGNSQECIEVPTSNDFRSFYTGKKILTAEGTLLPVGPIIMDTVHPNLFWQASDAQAFYADTGCAVADVRLYTNEHGIVAAGVVRPTATAAQVRRLRASDVSPDWRPIGGQHKVVTLLACNVSGFLVEGIAASAGRFQPWGGVDLESGQMLGLVAAGAIHQGRRSVGVELAEVRAELAEHRQALGVLLAPRYAADRRARMAVALDTLGLDCSDCAAKSRAERLAAARSAFA